MIKYFTHDQDSKFCKIVDEDCLRNDDLMIAALSREFWDDISSPIGLVLPGNCIWRLHWKQHDDTHVILNNWKRFAEGYSLKQNQVLFFKYVEKSYPISIFRVSIFDLTGKEIGYPVFSSFFYPWKIKTSKPAVRHGHTPLHPPKKMKTNPTGSGSTPPQMTKPHDDIAKGKREVPYNTRGSPTINETVVSEEDIKRRSRALENAKASVFQNNNTFIRQMRPSYIQRNVLALPPNFFLTTHQLKEKEYHECAVLLTPPNNGFWHLKLKINTCNGQIISFNDGWKNFVADNKLKIGDVCLFELLTPSTGDVLFEVVIFRARKQ